MSRRLEVNVGDRFGDFTVLEVIDAPEARKVRTLCSCGKEEVRLLRPVVSGKAKYCGSCSYTKRQKDLRGKKFGRLTCLEREEVVRGDNKYTFWKCLCDCGNIKSVNMSLLRNSPNASCGCYFEENKSKFNLTHGMSRSTEYGIFMGLKQRCENPNYDGYVDYGGRGIKCLFDNFEEFYSALGDRPPGATIERHDVNGNYCKENCYWETNWSVQSFNRRGNKNRKYDLPVGVFFMKSSGTYYASVTKDGKRHAVWGLKSIKDALAHVKELELEVFGFQRDRSDEEGINYEEN